MLNGISTMTYTPVSLSNSPNPQSLYLNILKEESPWRRLKLEVR